MKIALNCTSNRLILRIDLIEILMQILMSLVGLCPGSKNKKKLQILKLIRFRLEFSSIISNMYLKKLSSPRTKSEVIQYIIINLQYLN